MVPHGKWFIYLASVIAAPYLASAAQIVRNEVPFRLLEGCRIVVAGSVAASNDLSMMIDTGADCSLVDPRVVKRLGLPVLSERVRFNALGRTGLARRTILRRLRLGSILTTLPCLVADIPFGKIDAIIGLDLLRRYSFTLDFEVKTTNRVTGYAAAILPPRARSKSLAFIEAWFGPHPLSRDATCRTRPTPRSSTSCIHSQGPVAARPRLWGPERLLSQIGRVPIAKADAGNRLSVVTFKQPVEIPGMVLAPGKYAFRLLNPNQSLTEVEVLNAKTHKAVAILESIPEYRIEPINNSEFDMAKTNKNSPERIGVWWYPGDMMGLEFLYPEQQ